MTIKELTSSIEPADRTAEEQAGARWQQVAKPLGSLGLLESAVCRLAGAQHTHDVDISRRALVVFCADNGVVAEGVTQTGQEITALVARNLSAGRSVACCMAETTGTEIVPVDIGMSRTVEVPNLLRRSVRPGTADIACGPAMSREEAEQAILTGAELVRELKDQGYRLLMAGEMGIGNTTTSSAAASVLLGEDPGQMTGRGAGLSTGGLSRKISVIEQAIAVNHPDPGDPVDVLARVGGLDLAGLAGLCLGGAMYHVPVLLDGFITTVAALAAKQMCSRTADYLLASHQSGEPAGARMLEALGLKPLLHAGLRLGEGTGAIAVLPVLDMALRVYKKAPTFEEINMEAYRPLD